MNDTMSFTTMSANVLKQPYKDQYINVYQKGSLIGMCLDIIIREKAKERHSWFDAKLANEYGVSKPFNDNELLLKLRL
jgi:predicted metalloprotease with PDZ domain